MNISYFTPTLETKLTTFASGSAFKWFWRVHRQKRFSGKSTFGSQISQLSNKILTKLKPKTQRLNPSHRQVISERKRGLTKKRIPRRRNSDAEISESGLRNIGSESVKSTDLGGRGDPIFDTKNSGSFFVFGKVERYLKDLRALNYIVLGFKTAGDSGLIRICINK